MRPAPALTVRCTGGWPWRLLHTALPALAATAFAAWLLGHAELALMPAVGVGLITGFALTWRWRGGMRVLGWDGRRWALDGQVGRLQLMMDLGALLVLRLRPDSGRAPWFAVTAPEAGSAWHGLRAAAYARPPEATAHARPPQRPAA